MRIAKILCTSLLLTVAVSIPAFATSSRVSINGNGTAEDIHSACGLGKHSVGVKRYYNGKDTYGYSYVNPTDNSKKCYTKVSIGRASFPKHVRYGYAQSPQEVQEGSHTVSEEHGVSP
ncbi:MAG: hypothetical protein ACRC30_06310 [Clostridium sp.]